LNIQKHLPQFANSKDDELGDDDFIDAEEITDGDR
jgi:hypothetical protein